MLLNLKLIYAGLTALFLLGAVYFIYDKGYNRGKAYCEQAQIKHEQKVKKKYDKIDKQTPFNKSMHDKLEWLFQYGRDESEPES